MKSGFFHWESRRCEDYFHQDILAVNLHLPFIFTGTACPSRNNHLYFTSLISVLEPLKFLAEQMAQLVFHITSAKAIASQVLGSTPDPSHWRDNFERGVETLNYFKQVLNSLHPTGYNYPVYMDNFFQYFTSTGTVHQGPKAKRRKTTSGIPAPTQTLSEELRKVNLHRVHQQVNLHPCIFQVLLQFNRTCMLMIVIMLKLPTQSTTPSLKFLSVPLI